MVTMIFLLALPSLPCKLFIILVVFYPKTVKYIKLMLYIQPPATKIYKYKNALQISKQALFFSYEGH